MKPIYLDEIDSTHSYILDILPQHGPHEPISVYTFNQYKGKGQANKKWSCKPNAGIALSVAVPFPQNKETDWVLFNKHICSGIVTFLNEHINPGFKLKWPNDIIYNDRKFGGMIMNIVRKDDIDYFVLGLGLNLKQPPRLPQAIGLLEILHLRKFNPKPFTIQLIQYLKKHMALKPKKNTNSLYHDLLWQLNQVVTVQFYNQNTGKVETTENYPFICVDFHGRAFFNKGNDYVGGHNSSVSILLPPRKK